MIETERLILLPYSPSHLLAMIEGAEAFEKVAGYPAAPGLCDFMHSGDVSQAWLERLRAATEPIVWDHGFGLVERRTRVVLGGITFKGPPDADGMVELAYGIAPDFQNRGYATEAARACVTFAFSEPTVRVVRAHTLPTNNASTRVLTKCGFTKLGEVIEPEDGLVWRWELQRP